MFSRNFLTTIKFVDENIKDIEKIITDFYNDDGKTTFLMTSDHGMTDWGKEIFKLQEVYFFCYSKQENEQSYLIL